MIITLKQSAKVGAWLLVAAVVAVAPLNVGAVATDTKNTVINATVAPVISMTTSTPIAIALTPTAGGVVSSSSDTVTINSNNSIGYNLTLADSDATTTLVSGANSIAAHSGTMAASTALAANTWGWAIPTATVGAASNNFDASYATETNATSSATKWAGMPASGAAVTIKNTTVPATNDTLAVWYAVKVTSAKPTGVYTDTVTYTATTN